MKKSQQKQIELQEELQSNGFNIIHCHSCSSPLIHRTDAHNYEAVEIECPGCDAVIFSDDAEYLWYEGMPEIKTKRKL